MHHTSGRNAEVQKPRQAHSNDADEDSFTSLLELTHSYISAQGARVRTRSMHSFPVIQGLSSWTSERCSPRDNQVGSPVISL